MKNFGFTLISRACQCCTTTVKACSGFTLIELLVVISIIGIVSAVVYGTFGSGIERGRDTERKSDIANYKLALENFATNNNSFYPVSATTNRLSQFCTSYFSSYIPDCPEDARYPADNTFVYNYQAAGNSPQDPPGTLSALRYVLWSKLETGARIWVSCSNGKSGEVAQAGFVVANANCPL